MRLKDEKLGEVELEIQVEKSTVDSFIMAGLSLTLERDLTHEELDYLNESYDEEVQWYAWENGSLYHN